MSTGQRIAIDILPGRPGEPPTVRVSTEKNMELTALTDNSDTAMVGRAMLQSAAYLFAQGQPVQFGPEVPLEALR